MPKQNGGGFFTDSDETLTSAFCSQLQQASLYVLVKTQPRINWKIRSVIYINWKKFNEYKQSEEDIETKKKIFYSFQTNVCHLSWYIAKDVIEKTKELLGVDRCSLFIGGYEKNILWSKFADSKGDRIEHMHSGIVGKVLQSGQAMNIKIMTNNT